LKYHKLFIYYAYAQGRSQKGGVNRNVVLNF